MRNNILETFQLWRSIKIHQISCHILGGDCAILGILQTRLLPKKSHCFISSSFSQVQLKDAAIRCSTCDGRNCFIMFAKHQTSEVWHASGIQVSQAKSFFLGFRWFTWRYYMVAISRIFSYLNWHIGKFLSPVMGALRPKHQRKDPNFVQDLLQYHGLLLHPVMVTFERYYKAAFLSTWSCSGTGAKKNIIGKKRSILNPIYMVSTPSSGSAAGCKSTLFPTTW